MRQTSRHGGVFERKTVSALASEHVRETTPHGHAHHHKVRRPHHHKKHHHKGHHHKQTQGIPQPLIEGG